MNRVTVRSISVLCAVGRQARPHRQLYRFVIARTFASTHSPSPVPPTVTPTHDQVTATPAPPQPTVAAPTPGLTDASGPPTHTPAAVHAAQPPPDTATATAPDAQLGAADAVANAPISAPDAGALAAAADAAAAAPEAVADAAAAAATTSTSFSDTLLMPATWLLTSMHEWTGLPWWASIALSTVAIRTLLLPVTVLTMKNSALMGALKTDIADRREAAMAAMRTGDRALATLRQSEMQTFMREAGVAPGRVLLGPLAQFPVFISFFVGIRRMALNDPSFTTGGAAWFTNLAVMDPNYVLPVICGASLLFMTELGGDSGAKMTPQMKMGMRGIALLSVPMTYWFPAAIFCYWIPNNLCSAGVNLVMRTKPAKRLLGLHIDTATIPGTRAFKAAMAQKARDGQTVTMEAIDPALAAASYARGRPTPSAATVQPVLLKASPKKKKTASRTK